MPSLNRFPLLGLWAKEAALRLGHTEADAQTIGHAYAVLYAIRANSPVRATAYKDKEAIASAEEALSQPSEIELLDFGGDRLEISRGPQGQIVGRVGGRLPQTPETFRYKVASKFPASYLARLESAFHAFFAARSPEKIDGKAIYSLYDQWKKQCANGRLVDLDRLIGWCEKSTKAK